MPGCARVDHGDANASTVVAKLLARRRRADGRAGPFHDTEHDAVGRQVLHARMRRQGGDRRVWQRDDRSVDDWQRRAPLAAETQDGRRDLFHRGRVSSLNDDLRPAGAARRALAQRGPIFVAGCA